MSVGVHFSKSLTKRRSEMAMIYVKTRPGRRAYWEGREIPHDKFVPVPDTPFIRRLITHHEDVEIEGGKETLKKVLKPRKPKE